MELRQLEYLVAVAEEANFTRAASKVHVAQPGVSAQVRQLEHELGQPLFDRSGRRVRLTNVGVAVLPYARAALDRDSGVAAPNATFRTATHLATVEVIDDLLIGVSKDQPKVSGTMTIFYANGFTIFTPALLKSLTLRVATVMP
jgi:DNA-binding transcriptional LysR family regulator